MKKIFLFITIYGLFSQSMQAQISRIAITKNRSSAVPTPVYTLTAARATITTGGDNKEFPSEVTFWLIQKGKGILFNQPGANMRNEMKVNTSTEFGLIKWTGKNPGTYLLTDLQSSGLIFRVLYMPNLFTDAWRVEGISVTLEFRDQNGNLHPTLGTKTIVFNNTSGFLNTWEQFFECRADGNFNPITSSILQDASGFN